MDLRLLNPAQVTAWNSFPSSLLRRRPIESRNRSRSPSSRKIASRRSPRFMTWQIDPGQIAPGYSTLNLRGLAILYVAE